MNYRHLIADAHTVLMRARAFRGYEGGPLAEPFSEIVERRLREAVDGPKAPGDAAVPTSDEELEEVADAFLAYYLTTAADGALGCSNCGGVPHTTTCFAGRLQRAVESRRANVPPVFDGLIAALGRRVVGNEKQRDHYRAAGLKSAQDRAVGRLEAFNEALRLIQLVRAGASLALVDPKEAVNG